MWWLHGLSLKFSFRKKNKLFRCVFSPILSLFPFICCLHYQLCIFSKVLTPNHHLRDINSSSPSFLFFPPFLPAFQLFLLNPWTWNVILVAAAVFIGCPDINVCICVCMCPSVNKYKVLLRYQKRHKSCQTRNSPEGKAGSFGMLGKKVSRLGKIKAIGAPEGGVLQEHAVIFICGELRLVRNWVWHCCCILPLCPPPCLLWALCRPLLGFS